MEEEEAESRGSGTGYHTVCTVTSLAPAFFLACRLPRTHWVVLRSHAEPFPSPRANSRAPRRSAREREEKGE
eukprot:2999044-Pyramimonas_sp.AAC.1